ncbi:hypothetical protein CN675_24440 [Bacillus toyonensis]|nr:hypothetical protein CN675_24440 [Bacillus toyonensis]
MACFPPSGTHISCKYYFLKKKGFVGNPTIDESTAPDGVGRYRHYRNNDGEWSIYWHPDTGAHEVHGAIRDKWASFGWERFGYPITDELTPPDLFGRYNHFRAIHLPGKPEASIYWSPRTGAHEVHGAIRDKWAELGWEKSFLGYPITDELTTPDGVGRYNHFLHVGRLHEGSIYWTPETGAHEVHGAIRDKWASFGWERFGYPITDELTTPDGFGRYNHFRAIHLPGKPEASIYLTSYAAYAVYGAIRTKWAELGWEKSPLGYPTSDEKDRPGGGRIQNFEKGEIRWDPRTGAHVEVYQFPTPPPPPTHPPTPPPTHPPTPPSTVGYSRVSIYNCHTDRRSIIIWVNDGSGLKEVTTLNHQYNDYGTCPAGEPHVLELKNGLWHHVVCVDVGAIGCGVNDPNQVACQRYTFSILGNSNGSEAPPVIVS